MSVRSTNQPVAGETDLSLPPSLPLSLSLSLSLSLAHTFVLALPLSLPSHTISIYFLLSYLLVIAFSASVESSRNTPQLRGKQQDLVKDQAVNQSSLKRQTMYSAGPSTDHTPGESERACPRMPWSEGPQKAGHAGGSAAAAVFLSVFPRRAAHNSSNTEGIKSSNPLEMSAAF